MMQIESPVNVIRTDGYKPQRRTRAASFDSVDNNYPTNDPWGWFDDFENNLTNLNHNAENAETNSGRLNMRKTLSLPLPASNAPSYVLESTVETQHLWYETAGQRPQQPKHEREYFESLWKRNFENSRVDYSQAPKVQTPQEREDENLRVDVVDGTIKYRGRGPFSIAVSKSFQNHDISCVTLQVSLCL